MSQTISSPISFGEDPHFQTLPFITYVPSEEIEIIFLLEVRNLKDHQVHTLLLWSLQR